MEGTVWRNRADPLRLIRVTEYRPPGILVVATLPKRVGGKGEPLVLSKEELWGEWQQTSIEEWEAACLKFAPPARPTDVPPDLIGAVFGFRAWQLDAAGYLTSQGKGLTTWETGRNVAVCVADFADGHRAPIENCGCGLYAYHDPSEVELIRFEGESFPIAGIVRAWGDMEVHHAGIRAEYAEIVALCAPVPAILAPRPLKHPLMDAFAKAVKRYDAEVIECDPQVMRAWVTAQPDGDVVPEEMRPELNTRPADMFWAPPVSMTESGVLRVNGKPRAHTEAFEIRDLPEGQEPIDRPDRMMLVGDVRYPGHVEKNRAVAYVKLARRDRFLLKYDKAVNWVGLLFVLVFLLTDIRNLVMGVAAQSVFQIVWYLVLSFVMGYMLPFWIRRVRRKD